MKNLLFVLMLCASVSASGETWIREYSYKTGPGDTETSSRSIASHRLRQNLLEEIGIYMHSEIQSGYIQQDGNFTDLNSNTIKSVSAGAVPIEMTEEAWDGSTYTVRAKIDFDAQELAAAIKKAVSDQRVVSKLAASNASIQDILTRMDEIRGQALPEADSVRTTLSEQYYRLSQYLDAEECFARAVYADMAGDDEQAIVLYQRAVLLKPEYGEAHHDLGVLLMSKGQYEGAESCLLTAAQLLPMHHYAYVNLGNLRKEQGDPVAALQYYRQAQALKPDDARVLFNIAGLYQDNGYPDKAIEHYLMALEIDSLYTDAYYNLGILYRKSGQLSEAVQAYQKVIQTDPTHANAYNNLGYVYDELGDASQALASYLKATQIAPLSVNAHINLGTSYLSGGMLEQAIATLIRATELDPGSALAYYNLGLAYSRTVFTDRAVECFETAVRIDPNHSRAYYNLGILYHTLGNATQARENMQKASALGHAKSSEWLKKQGWE